MNKKQLDAAEKIIRAGLVEAQKYITARAEELKLETPNQPIGTLEQQLMRNSGDYVQAALFDISQCRMAMEREEAA